MLRDLRATQEQLAILRASGELVGLVAAHRSICRGLRRVLVGLSAALGAVLDAGAAVVELSAFKRQLQASD
jgi:hypothetical protein